jgi:hypothetical protein
MHVLLGLVLRCTAGSLAPFPSAPVFDRGKDVQGGHAALVPPPGLGGIEGDIGALDAGRRRRTQSRVSRWSGRRACLATGRAPVAQTTGRERWLCEFPSLYSLGIYKGVTLAMSMLLNKGVAINSEWSLLLTRNGARKPLHPPTLLRTPPHTTRCFTPEKHRVDEKRMD